MSSWKWRVDSAGVDRGRVKTSFENDNTTAHRNVSTGRRQQHEGRRHMARGGRIRNALSGGEGLRSRMKEMANT